MALVIIAGKWKLLSLKLMGHETFSQNPYCFFIFFKGFCWARATSMAQHIWVSPLTLYSSCFFDVLPHAVFAETSLQSRPSFLLPLDPASHGSVALPSISKPLMRPNLLFFTNTHTHIQCSVFQCSRPNCSQDSISGGVQKKKKKNLPTNLHISFSASLSLFISTSAKVGQWHRSQVEVTQIRWPPWHYREEPWPPPTLVF